MILSDLEQKRIAIWGLGREGLSSLAYLRQHFPNKLLTLINRERPDKLPDDPRTEFIREQDMVPALARLDVVIKAPGISLYDPRITDMKDRGITVTSATNIWFSTPRKGRIIALTGSNGKSTTSALLTHILSGRGKNVALGGNIGTPVLSLRDDADIYVVELSSYQTADLHYAPDIAVLLNLFPEHIQWHKSHEQYFTDKCQLIHSGAQTVILNHTDVLTRDRETPPPEGTIWFNDPAGLHGKGTHIYKGDSFLGDATDLRLPGAHNRQNLCAALTVCQALQLDLPACFKQALTFGGLPHRLEHLGARDGITFINDSISTTPEAALAALKSFPDQPITLIAGGQDRQQDYAPLACYIAAHPDITVIAAYETGARIIGGLPEPQGIKAEDLKSAVKKARTITPKGGLILLSPAAPSYDAFQNFEERGEIFRGMFAEIKGT